MVDGNNTNQNKKVTETTTVNHEYIFGFGSIINTDTHSTWLGPTIESLPGIPACITSSFGYRRGWFFRSKTGFTALGITQCAIKNKNDNDDNGDTGAMDINGVLFRVESFMMNGFDKREVGYDRVQVPMQFIQILSNGTMSAAATTTDQEEKRENNDKNDNSTSITTTEITLKNSQLPTPNSKVWIYVPQQSSYATADEDHPILQSYVDTVLRGCLSWGGETMAREFVQTTTSWSPYFLNDTPSSRRPWLHRKQYDTIDK
eukprot:6541678-Ditylum_brightwellii.AAC.1